MTIIEFIEILHKERKIIDILKFSLLHQLTALYLFWEHRKTLCVKRPRHRRQYKGLSICKSAVYNL